jgi:glutamate/aspartate transport system substrate-binding protein
MRNAAILFLALLIAVSAAAEAQTGVLDRVRQKGVITLGYIDGAAPFSFVGEDKQPQGYSADLCREIAVGIRAQLKLREPRDALGRADDTEPPRSGAHRARGSRVQHDDLDPVAQAEVDFSLITFVDGGSILTKSGPGGGRLLDFDGKRVAVISGTTTEKVCARDWRSARSRPRW